MVVKSELAYLLFRFDLLGHVDTVSDDRAVFGIAVFLCREIDLQIFGIAEFSFDSDLCIIGNSLVSQKCFDLSLEPVAVSIGEQCLQRDFVVDELFAAVTEHIFDIFGDIAAVEASIEIELEVDDGSLTEERLFLFQIAVVLPHFTLHHHHQVRECIERAGVSLFGRAAGEPAGLGGCFAHRENRHRLVEQIGLVLIAVELAVGEESADGCTLG